MAARTTKKTRIETLTHDEKTRTNIPTAELESLADESNANLDKLSYERRNNPDVDPDLYDRDRDLDPQLVWRGKDDEDRLPLTIDFSPVYIQEKIHPKTIIDDIRRRSYDGNVTDGEETPNLFSEWSGELSPDDKIEFYKHDLKWANRLILGDSLQVMNSLATKEEIKGKVQCVFLDPPYGIKFNSNWQTSIGKRSSGESDISREPESIKAFRDTWKDGYNSYLSYLRDRLIISHELLSETGAIFLQIGEENFHRAKSLLDEVFGASNCVATISFVKTTSQTAKYLPIVCDYILFYAKNIDQLKFRKLYRKKDIRTSNYFMTDFGQQISRTDIEKNSNVSPRMYKPDNLTSQSGGGTTKFTFDFRDKKYPRKTGGWKTNSKGMKRLSKANRIHIAANSIQYVRYFDDFEYTEISSSWTDTTTGNFTEDKMYVVQTSEKVISRCLSMASDPGDIVLDPTCGSGTTGIVAERLGRRWILVDTSRVAINISRQRLMGAKYPYYATKDIELNEDSKKVNMKFSNLLVGKISSGFHFKKAPRITLRSIANNVLIDDIDERYSTEIESLLEKLNSILPEKVSLWNLPYEKDLTESDTKICYNRLIEVLRNRQRDIDAAITDGAETETFYDSPVEIPNITRVTGPFTVESLSPHKMLPTDDNTCIPSEDTMNAAPPPSNGDLVSGPEHVSQKPRSHEEGETKFWEIVHGNLLKAGIQNTKKGERLEFTTLEPWSSGRYINFDGRYMENGREKRAAVCVGPEFGTVTKKLIVNAAREAGDLFDLLIFLGFAFEAHADGDVLNLGRLTVIRARMNNDLHMANRLDSRGSGNLFVVFGEPDIRINYLDDSRIGVEIKGIDIFDPTTGNVTSYGPEGIACWFVDTDYNDEAFFIRQAYFPNVGSDPFKRIKTTLRAEINDEIWSSLYSTTGNPFQKPKTGRIAVKAINHYGDEVLKVFNV